MKLCQAYLLVTYLDTTKPFRYPLMVYQFYVTGPLTNGHLILFSITCLSVHMHTNITVKIFLKNLHLPCTFPFNLYKHRIEMLFFHFVIFSSKSTQIIICCFVMLLLLVMHKFNNSMSSGIFKSNLLVLSCFFASFFGC